jgi:hypothetical protein
MPQVLSDNEMNEEDDSWNLLGRPFMILRSWVLRHLVFGDQLDHSDEIPELANLTKLSSFDGSEESSRLDDTKDVSRLEKISKIDSSEETSRLDRSEKIFKFIEDLVDVYHDSEKVLKNHPRNLEELGSLEVLMRKFRNKTNGVRKKLEAKNDPEANLVKQIHSQVFSLFKTACDDKDIQENSDFILQEFKKRVF